MTAWNGSTECAPRLPAVFSAQPMPAQQTAIAQLAVALRGRHGRLDRGGIGDVGGEEARAVAEVVGERGPALLVAVGERDGRAQRVQPAGGGGAEAGRAARDEGVGSLDLHDGAGP